MGTKEPVIKMKRNVWMILAACLAALCTVFSVYAAPDAAPSDGRTTEGENTALFQSFLMGRQMYVFFSTGKEAPGEMAVSLYENGNYKEEKTATPLTDSGQYVHYFILLDNSGSVKSAGGEIGEFVLTLMRETKANRIVTIMTLGDSFAPIAESLEDDAMAKAMDGISYSDQTTNLYKGIDSALNCIDEKQRSRGDLYHLILITDGQPDGNSQTPTPDDVKKRVENRTDIAFDIVGVADWKEGNEKLLPASAHEPMIVQGEAQPQAAARELAFKTDCLYTVCFTSSHAAENAISDRKLILKGELNTILELPTPTVTGENRYEEHETAKPSDDGNETESSSGNESETNPDIDTGNEAAPEDKTAADSKTLPGNLPVYGIFLLGGFLLGAMSVLFLKHRTRKRYDIKAGFLHMEVIAGNCKTKKKEFSLAHTLLIGSGRECDIIWKEKDISEQSARIFMHDGIAYIEDLDSPQGTLLNGMRIFAPNRLRSEDIVSIGDVRFRVFF